MGDGVTREICGSAMQLNPEDPGLSQDLRIHGIREPHTTHAYRAALADLDSPTVVDIGANIGYYALQPCALHDDAQVIAIEPDPTNIEYLERNIELNEYGGVSVVQSGVGAEEATVEMYQAPESNLHTMNEQKARTFSGQHGSIDVPVQPLDAILQDLNIQPEAVDVLRMDIEGYEGQAIQGMTDLFDANMELLCNIEFHPILMTRTENTRLGERFGEMQAVSVAQGGTEYPHGTVKQALQRNWAEVVFNWTPDQ